MDKINMHALPLIPYTINVDMRLKLSHQMQ